MVPKCHLGPLLVKRFKKGVLYRTFRNGSRKFEEPKNSLWNQKLFCITFLKLFLVLYLILGTFLVLCVTFECSPERTILEQFFLSVNNNNNKVSTFLYGKSHD